MIRGGRNLVILGVLSVVVALSTTGVSLAIYHNSGDIYLDRSRPGYLPDKAEIEEGPSEDKYTFDKNATIKPEVLEDYLEHLAHEIETLDLYKTAFSSDALTDEALGI